MPTDPHTPDRPAGIDTGRDDLVYVTEDGTHWWLSGDRDGPDLSSMHDRPRAILRALLGLAIRRLDRAEEVSRG